MTPLQALRRTRSLTLTRKEERALIAAAKRGDKQARDRLLTCHMSYVMRTIYSLHRRGTPWTSCEELIGEGLIALHHALRKFEPKRRLRFSTYAMFWIRAYVARYLKGEVRQCANVSLDEEFPGCEDETRLDRLHDEEAVPADEAAESARVTAKVRAAALRLAKAGDARSRDIIESRILRDPEDAVTLERLGERHGCARERIRQIEMKLRAQLVERLKRVA